MYESQKEDKLCLYKVTPHGCPIDFSLCISNELIILSPCTIFPASMTSETGSICQLNQRFSGHASSHLSPNPLI